MSLSHFLALSLSLISALSLILGEASPFKDLRGQIHGPWFWVEGLGFLEGFMRLE